MILDRLLATQEVYGDPLISADEIERIQTIWAEEISKQTTKRGLVE